MIGVADVDPHGKAQQLAHEMVFQASADDLALVEKVFWTNEAHHAINQERVKSPGDAIGSGLECKLVDTVVSSGGEGTPLPCFEVHGLIADPGYIAMRSDARARDLFPLARVRG